MNASIGESPLTADLGAVTAPHFRNERSIEIAAAPAEVFPWLAQMGFGRAGWYSWDLIDNLGRRSATHLHEPWMVRAAGDPMPGGPIAFDTLVVDAPARLTIAIVERRLGPWRISFVLDYRLTSTSSGRAASTQLDTVATARIDGPLGRPFARFILGPGDGIMVAKQLRGVRKRAERRAQAAR